MKNIDVIIILGQGVNPDGTVPEHVQHEIIYALDLCKKQNIPAIIFSGNYWGLKKHSITQLSEAEAMKKFAETLDTESIQLIIEDISQDTISNIVFSKAIIDEHKWRNVLIFSVTPHLFRVKYIVDRVFGEKYTVTYHGHQTVTNQLQQRYFRHYAWIGSLYAHWILRRTWPDDNIKMINWLHNHHFLYKKSWLIKIAPLFLKSF